MIFSLIEMIYKSSMKFGLLILIVGSFPLIKAVFMKIPVILNMPVYVVLLHLMNQKNSVYNPNIFEFFIYEV